MMFERMMATLQPYTNSSRSTALPHNAQLTTTLSMFDLLDGSVIWDVALDGRIIDLSALSLAQWTAPRDTSSGETPQSADSLHSRTIAPGSVLALAENGRIWALRADTGSEIWEQTLPPGASLRGPAPMFARDAQTLVRGHTVVALWNKRLYALDLSTGALLWTYPAMDVDSRAMTAGPLVVQGAGSLAVYVTAAGALAARPGRSNQARRRFQTLAIRLSDGSILWGEQATYAMLIPPGSPAFTRLEARNDLVFLIARSVEMLDGHPISAPGLYAVDSMTGIPLWADTSIQVGATDALTFASVASGSGAPGAAQGVHASLECVVIATRNELKAYNVSDLRQMLAAQAHAAPVLDARTRIAQREPDQGANASETQQNWIDACRLALTLGQERPMMTWSVTNEQGGNDPASDVFEGLLTTEGSLIVGRADHYRQSYRLEAFDAERGARLWSWRAPDLSDQVSWRYSGHGRFLVVPGQNWYHALDAHRGISHEAHTTRDGTIAGVLRAS